MANVELYTKEGCPYCDYAKQLLDELGQVYTEVRVDLDPDKLTEMLERADGRRSVPQIIIDGQAIGGFDDMAALHKAGELTKLLKGG